MKTTAILTFVVIRNRRESNECFNAFLLYGYTRCWDDGIWNEAWPIEDPALRGWTGFQVLNERFVCYEVHKEAQ